MQFRKALNYILVFIAVSVAVWFMFSYTQRGRTFYGDSMGYYMYLPATFIYNNHKSITDLPDEKHVSSDAVYYLQGMGRNAERTPLGYVLNQYTYGIALMEMPFFFIAHAYEKAMDLPATGYTTTYDDMIKVSSLIYAIWGLILLYKILRRYFTTRASLLGVVCIFLGTNLFWFTVYQAGMAHVPLFFLYASMVYLTIRLHDKPTSFLFGLLGFTAGLMTVIRPTDIICLLIPLLYNVYDKESWRLKWAFIKLHAYKVVLMALVFVLPVIPQLLYWKMLTGQYIYYSYGSQTFNWNDPHITAGLFYFANGWLPYSPIMIASIIGLVFYKKIRSWSYCIWLIFPLYIYIAYSWYNYTYINGLGSRPMIHIYPLLAIPLTAFISYVSRKSIAIKALVLALFLFSIALNISYSMQRAKGVLASEESNFVFNYRTLFRTRLNYYDLVAFDISEQQPKEHSLQKVGVLIYKDYEDSLSESFVRDTTLKSNFVRRDTVEHPEKTFIRYNKAAFKNARWLRYSGRFMIPNGPNDYRKHILVAGIKRGDNFVEWWGCKLLNKIGVADSINPYTRREDLSVNQMIVRKWGYVHFFVPITSKVKEGDEIMLEMWNMGKQGFYFDDLCVELYK